MISNGFVALSGALYAQSIKVADLQLGVGTIVIGLAAIILGLGIIKKSQAVNERAQRVKARHQIEHSSWRCCRWASATSWSWSRPT